MLEKLMNDLLANNSLEIVETRSDISIEEFKEALNDFKGSRIKNVFEEARSPEVNER